MTDTKKILLIKTQKMEGFIVGLMVGVILTLIVLAENYEYKQKRRNKGKR